MYVKPALPYSYDALMPYYSAETLVIHEKLHQGYVDNYNKILNKIEDLRQKEDFTNIKHIMKDLAFFGSGTVLHTLFFQNLTPPNIQNIPIPIRDLLIREFGSVDDFKKEFTAAATNIEGNGWAIFGWHSMLNKYLILTAENHQNLTIWDYEPIFVVDMWEHSYFLQNLNLKTKYMENIWNIVNWDELNKRYLKITK
jgi:Fe-Mn family superoxide dismutase